MFDVATRFSFDTERKLDRPRAPITIVVVLRSPSRLPGTRHNGKDMFIRLFLLQEGRNLVTGLDTFKQSK
jgi:hypothetical protein